MSRNDQTSPSTRLAPHGAPGAWFTLKKAVVDPAALGPDDAFQANELRYKIMGQKGTLILALPPAP